MCVCLWDCYCYYSMLFCLEIFFIFFLQIFSDEKYYQNEEFLIFLSNPRGVGRKLAENRAFTPFLPLRPRPPRCFLSSKLGRGTVTGSSSSVTGSLGGVCRGGGGGGVVRGLGSRSEAVVAGGSGGGRRVVVTIRLSKSTDGLKSKYVDITFNF